MSIISVINYKGGVGKTTVTANLAAELTWRGYEVQKQIWGLIWGFGEASDGLREIFNSGNPMLIHGIHASISAFQLAALRGLRIPMRKRPPDPKRIPSTRSEANRPVDPKQTVQ